jgi:hypothetical protein
MMIVTIAFILGFMTAAVIAGLVWIDTTPGFTRKLSRTDIIHEMTRRG